MNKFYVTKEIAEKLRAKGYDVEEIVYEASLLNIDEVYFSSTCRMYKLPRIDEVLSWLREEKKIHVATGYSALSYWRFVIMYTDDRAKHEPAIIVRNKNSCEDAYIDGITYCLDNLI